MNQQWYMIPQEDDDGIDIMLGFTNEDGNGTDKGSQGGARSSLALGWLADRPLALDATEEENDSRSTIG